jgi:hypothetical protein
MILLIFRSVGTGNRKVRYRYGIILLLFTRYTKMGYAGNKEPQFIMPSAIAVKETAKVRITYFYMLTGRVQCMYGTVLCVSAIAVTVGTRKTASLVTGTDKCFTLGSSLESVPGTVAICLARKNFFYNSRVIKWLIEFYSHYKNRN